MPVQQVAVRLYLHQVLASKSSVLGHLLSAAVSEPATFFLQQFLIG
jgi:hypothetical protein